MTQTTVLWPVILFARAEAADHTIGVLIGMVRCFVVAFITRKDSGAAAEAEPTVGLIVVLTATATREFLACDDAEFFFRLVSIVVLAIEERPEDCESFGIFTLLRAGAIFALAEALTRRNFTSGILKAYKQSVPWASREF